MSPQDRIVQQLRQGRGPEAATLDEYLDKAGLQAWNSLNDFARRSPEAVDEKILATAIRRRAEAPGSFFALLLNVAAKDVKRRAALLDKFLELLPSHPEPALGAAGYNLHEYHYLLDPRFIAAARTWFDHDPEGGFGILESAAMYEPHLLAPEDVDFCEARRAAWPRDFYVVFFSLAPKRPELLPRVLAVLDEHPKEAVEAAAFSAKDEAVLLVPELFAGVLRHFEANPEKAWEFFAGAARVRPEAYDDVLLDALGARAGTEPGTLFDILRTLMDVEPSHVRALLDRYTALVRRHPKEGIESVKYRFQGEGIRLIRPDLVKAVCEGFAANAYPVYSLLRRLAEERPELLGRPEVDAAIANIPHATNYAFGFFNELLKLRPEFTHECTLALFECLALEPDHRAFVRAEQMNAITAISEAAHVRTGLEKALREPPRVGSRRARALMAIMFRQTLRARRHVLLEALRHAAGVVFWRRIPGAESERYSPVWDFTWFIIDQSGDDAVSTAAAERFLEGAFQLHYLCRTGREYEEFLVKLDLGHPPPAELPAGVRFLDPRLYSLVVELGRRFGTAPRLGVLEAFAGRLDAARRELAVIGANPKLAKRRENLAFRIACWEDPAYGRAFDDPAAEAALAGPARDFLKKEKKDLAKDFLDALRAEAIRIALAAVDNSRLGLYKGRLHDILGRDVDLDRIEPKILPSFLWFQAVEGMPKNRKGLKRLIEDRIEGREHAWLRTEPEAVAWAEKVRASRPEILLERWRAPFAKDFQYRPKDAKAEKQRRIKADLAQARALLEKAGGAGLASDAYEVLAARLAELKRPPAEDEKDPRPAPDPAALEEVELNLERVRIAEQTPESDFEGRLTLTVEHDPFEILFMGEYGFASCLSLRGSNAWSAVSNAIDVDKTVVWAREPGGNVVGRRLLALMPQGMVMFRTYVNRNALGLDAIFDAFVEAYAAHCGTVVARQGGHPVPLLSDRWYDDGAVRV